MAYDKEREAIKSVYPNEKWKTKVNKMTDNQVTAIYMRFMAQGKIKV